MLQMSFLQLKDEDLVIDGDVRLIGETRIENGSLTVSGSLILCETKESNPRLEIINGNLTAGEICTETKEGTRVLEDEICDYFYVDGNIHITSGNLDIGRCVISHADEIIVEDGDLLCGGIIEVFSVYVSDQIASCDSIGTLSDIFCDSMEVGGTIHCGRDLYASSYIDINGYDIFVKGTFKTENLYNGAKIEIG